MVRELINVRYTLPHRLRVEKVLFQPESYFLEPTSRSRTETSL